MKKHLKTIFVTTQGTYLANRGETISVKRNVEIPPFLFHTSIDSTGVYKLEITICDFKLGGAFVEQCLYAFTEQGVFEKQGANSCLDT
jgi:hypothetical protein